MNQSKLAIETPPFTEVYLFHLLLIMPEILTIPTRYFSLKPEAVCVCKCFLYIFSELKINVK